MKELNEIHLKYVDDMLIAESINMKEQLETNPIENRPLPDDFHARTGHCLPLENSKVHSQLMLTKKYAEDNQMKLNLKKTKLILFNPGRVRDFMPNFTIEGKDIELVEQTILLGVVVRSDLSWTPHVEYIVGRSNKKLWILRRLKKWGADQDDLKEIYLTQVRSILEFAAPVWHPALTGEQRVKLERVQKSAMHIILSDDYKSSSSARKLLGLRTLHDRRQLLCKKFAKKSFKHQKFSKWFKLNEKVTKTRCKQPKLCNVVSRTSRFEKSPISFLTSLLNKMAE